MASFVATPSRKVVTTREKVLTQSSKSGKHTLTHSKKVRETGLRTFLWDNPVIKKLYRESQEKAKGQAESRQARLAEIKRQQSSMDDRRVKLAELRRAKEAWIASKKV